MATLTVVAINNKSLTTGLAKQFNYDQVVFGPVAFVPANHSPNTSTGLAYFTYDEGLARPTKYVVSDNLATTRAYFLAAGALRTTAVPASALLPSIGVGVYGTPVVEEGLAETAAIVSNLNTATNKTVAGHFSAAYYGESKNTAAVGNATIVTYDGLTTTRANVYEAYGIRAKLTIAVATATNQAYGMLTSVFGHTTITGAVSKGMVSSGAFILGGAAAVTESCYGVYISVLTGVTTLTAALGIANAGNAGTGIALSGTYGTGIILSACTTGISLAGAVTTGISITGNATTAITVNTGTVTTGISLAACTTGVALTGAMTNAISVSGASSGSALLVGGTSANTISITGNVSASAFKISTGTVVNMLEVGTAANLTNFIKFNAIGGALVANALIPAAAPDAGTVGADAAITILVGATPYYIPLYNSLHA